MLGLAVGTLAHSSARKAEVVHRLDDVLPEFRPIRKCEDTNRGSFRRDRRSRRSE